jgi:hypothetical protein
MSFKTIAYNDQNNLDFEALLKRTLAKHDVTNNINIFNTSKSTYTIDNLYLKFSMQFSFSTISFIDLNASQLIQMSNSKLFSIVPNTISYGLYRYGQVDKSILISQLKILKY